ncbi:MAG TPA: hypothetical protein PLC98_25160 [Anaerolineales bacterium]|nr:hypothetical protein [Anaerolineales bacterium]
MDLYTQLAQWTGWPPVVALLLIVGAAGAVLYTQRDNARLAMISALQQQISLLQEKSRLLQEKITTLEETTPDILVGRLKRRNEIADEELRAAEQSDVTSKEEILRLRLEVDKTRGEAQSYEEQLRRAQDELMEFALPRGGKVRQELASELLAAVNSQHAMFVPVRFGDTIFGSVDAETAISAASKPIRAVVRLYSPGMNQTYVRLTTADFTHLGRVICPYVDTYERDYFDTLFAILAYSAHEELALASEITRGDEPDLARAIAVHDVSFHAVSPVDPTMGYFRVPLSGELNWLLREMGRQYGHQSSWYVPADYDPDKPSH